MLETGLIVGGWDKYEGGKIYSVPLGGTLLEQPFAIGGVSLLMTFEVQFCLMVKVHLLCINFFLRALGKDDVMGNILLAA